MAIDERNLAGGPKRNGNQNPGDGAARYGRGGGAGQKLAAALGGLRKNDPTDAAAVKNREIFEEVLDESAFRDLLKDMIAKAKAGSATMAVALLQSKIGRPANRVENPDASGSGDAAAVEAAAQRMLSQMQDAGVDTSLIERAVWSTDDDELAEPADDVTGSGS